MSDLQHTSNDFESQISNLRDLYNEFVDYKTQLESEKKDWPEEIAADFERIIKASDKLHELLGKLEADSPSDTYDDFAFWSERRHDLRTPINGIKNYSEMIIEDLEHQKFNTTTHLFQKLIQCIEKTLPIIDNMGRHTQPPKHNERFMTTSPEDDDSWYEVDGGTILIIDDNGDNREILKRRLRKAGLSVLEAKDGYEGLKMVEDNTIDLILLDIMMPRLNGYEVLERLKTKETYTHIPILMISSVTELSSIVRCIEAGADDYLPTPFNPVLLKARISACLEKKRAVDHEKEFTRQLETAQRQLEAAIESIDEGFAIFDSHDQLVKYNAPFQALYSELFNIGPSLISYDTFLRENLANGTFSPDRRLHESPKDWLNRHTMWHHAPHTPLVERIIPLNKWIEIQEYKTPDGGTVSIHKDITQRKAEEDRLSHLALHDPLTGIANRPQFEKSLEETLKDSEENQTFFSLLFLDLDGFKAVNDTLGHEFGDYLLVKVAERIQSCIRSKDIAARFGGDEFAVLLPKSQDLETTKLIAERILEGVGHQVTHEGETAQFGVSIGITTYPQDGTKMEDLMKAADKAMYAAKRAGKGQYKVYADILKAC